MIVSTPEVGEWVAKRTFGTYEGSPTLGQVSDKIVAGVIYSDWNGASLKATIAVDGIMTPTYLAAIFHYPFLFLGAKKIICTIAESNENSIHLCKKMGFTQEAQILDAHPDGSMLIFTLHREDCRFIGERYVKKLKVA